MLFTALLASVHVAYASGWTGPSLTQDINQKLDELQITSDKKKQTLQIREIKIAPEWGYAFIVYEVTDKQTDN